MDHPARFLVLRGGAVGDFVLTLPALAALRAAWPKAEIHLAGYPHIAVLGEVLGVVDRVVSLDKAGMARLFGRPRDLLPDLVDYIRSFDTVISYLYDPDELVKDNLQAAGARQVFCGSPKVEEGHAADWYARPLTGLAVFPDSGQVPALREDCIAAGRAWLTRHGMDRPAVLHPGSGSPSKNWPLDRFLELAKRLEASGVPVVFSVGEADEGAAGHLRGSGVCLADSLPLPELAGILVHARVYAGNDSGISHLAGTLGVPGLAIFGPSDPLTWGPRGLVHLRGADHQPSGVSTDAAWAVLQALLNGN